MKRKLSADAKRLKLLRAWKREARKRADPGIRLHKTILSCQRLLKKLRKTLDRLTPEEAKQLGELMKKEEKDSS